MPEFFERDAQGNLLNAISRPINIARRYREEVDITITGDLWLFSGELQSGLSWHYVLQQYDQAVAEAPKVDFVGYSVGLDRYRLRFSSSQVGSAGRTNLDLSVFHTPSHVNNNFANYLFLQYPQRESRFLHYRGPHRAAIGSTTAWNCAPAHATCWMRTSRSVFMCREGRSTPSGLT